MDECERNSLDAVFDLVADFDCFADDFCDYH